MNVKNNIVEELNDKLKELFVDQFDKVNGAKDEINKYLDSMDIESKYEYNSFCSDFLKVASNLLDSLTISDLQKMNIEYFVNEILSIMINYKIVEGEADDEKKLEKMIKHELKRKRGL